MIKKSVVPFGGVHGWLADLVVPSKAKSGFSRPKLGSDAYYVAEPDERRAMNAIRAHANVGKDAELTPRRSLSRREVTRLGLKPGQVRVA